jgi:hypothetical protein
MFTKTQLNRPTDINVSDVNFLQFLQEQFIRPESEQSIIICWGRKNNFKDGYSFWCSALAKLAQEMIIDRMYLNTYPEDESLLFEKITSEQAKTIIDGKLAGLRTSAAFPINEPISGGMKLCDDWDSKEIIGETQSSFFYFVWETTA